MEQELLARQAAGEEEDALQRLHYGLKYEGLTFLGGGFAFWAPFQLVLAVLYGLAAVFTPYMLWHLIRAKWYKSVVVFCLFVLAPFATAFLVPATASLTKYLLKSIPLVCFYIYTWALRLMIGQLLSDTRQTRLLNYERERRAL